MILLIGGVGEVCDMAVLLLLPSKKNIGIGRLWSEKWGESRGRGNYRRTISIHNALIKYSHRKPGLKSNASGKVPDRQPACQPRKLFGHADSNNDRKKLFIHPSIHQLRPKFHRQQNIETHNHKRWPCIQPVLSICKL